MARTRNAGLPRRLTLHRETLLRLEDALLRTLAGGGGVAIVPETEEPACYSPLCGPTFWKTCETQNAERV